MIHVLGIAPRNLQPQQSIPASAFRIPRTVWVALQFFRAAPRAPSGLDEADQEAEEEEEEGEIVTLGAFTTPDLANKRAGQAVLSCKMERLGKRERDRITRIENKAVMWKLLKKLDEEEQLFDQEVVTDDGGVGRVWVTVIEVQGPRN